MYASPVDEVWVAAVKAAASAIVERGGSWPVLGGVAFFAEFRMGKVATAKPDLDNLEKGVWDALTAVGVWKDDAQVVSSATSKVRAAPGEEGATIVVSWPA